MPSMSPSKSPVTKELTVGVSLTNNCNLRCPHCVVSAGDVTLKELSTEQWNNILGQLAECCPTSIILTGGEPLLRNDFLPLLKTTAACCKSISLETNGVLLDRHLDGLSGIENLRILAVSLDAWTPETGAKLQGSENLLPVTRNLERAARMGFGIQIITVLTKHNITEIPQIYAFASDIGATLRILPSIGCGGRGRYSQEQNVDPPRILAFAEEFVFPKMRSALACGQSKPNIHIHLPLPFIPFDLPPYNMTCSRNKFGILSNGEVAFCYRAIGIEPLLLGSVREKSLQAILAEVHSCDRVAYPEQSQFRGVCGKCVAFRVCRGSCPLDRFWLNGNFKSSNQFCQTLYEQGLFPEYALQP
jgi:radical SAM protein with 4Fe4S-binding SPASM domain